MIVQQLDAIGNELGQGSVTTLNQNDSVSISSIGTTLNGVVARLYAREARVFIHRIPDSDSSRAT